MPKKSGGPVTSEGKVRSSQNAIKHGITASSADSSQEKELVMLYTQELTEYYKPSSPLEKLQIERIAKCRAKLAHLYEVEHIRLQLAGQKLDQDPGKILEEHTLVRGVAKGMALEHIRYGQLRLPCHLDIEILRTIVKEILSHSGDITSLEQLERQYPSLCQYLNSYPEKVVGQMSSMAEILRYVSNELQYCLARGDHYMEQALFLFTPIVEKLKSKKEPPADSPEDDEIDAYIQERQKRFEAQYGKRPKSPEKIEPAFPPSSEIAKQLSSFTSIYRHHEAAINAVKHYEQILDLLKRSVTLPTNESDLLMRYQTTLERRLSSAIGELLELQRRKT